MTPLSYHSSNLSLIALKAMRLLLQKSISGLYRAVSVFHSLHFVLYMYEYFRRKILKEK